MNLVMDHLNILNSLCLVLGMDFKHTIHEIHPTLDDSEGEKDVTNNTVDSLANLIQRLRKVKIQRWQTVSMAVRQFLYFSFCTTFIFIITLTFC